MLILDTTSRSLQILLGGAGAMPFVTSWVDITITAHTPGTNHGVTNGATPVDLAAAPAASTYRQIKQIVVRNSTGGAATTTFRYKDGATNRDFASFALDAGDVVQYNDGEGFRVFDSTGKLKGTGGGGGGSITVEEVDGVPTYAGITTIRFDQADGFVVSQPGAGIARVDATGTPAPDEEAQLLAWLGM